MEESFESFEDALSDGDWGLIIGEKGELKGLFIPEGKDEEQVPESIIRICEDVFGVDITEDDISTTLH